MPIKKEITKILEKKLEKLFKKNKKQLIMINKKMDEVLLNPYRYKILKHNLKGIRRVHIDSSFVLIFEIKDEMVLFLDYDHHNNIY